MQQPSLRSLVRSLVPAAVALAALPPTAHAACYTMYDARNAAVYQSTVSPVDLRGSIADQMARRFPARYLVIEDSTNCIEIAFPQPTTSSPSAGARDPASLLRGTPDADRFGGPYLETSPAPQPSPYAAGSAGDVATGDTIPVGDGYPTGFVRGAGPGVAQSLTTGTVGGRTR